MSAERLALVDKAMEDSIEKSLLPGGIVMVARHGEIAHFKAYGKMDLEADKPMTTETIFRIYSMSKAVTTTAAMMLIDEGKLAVNDPVSKYLPELKNVMVARGGQSHRAERTMTIADLLRHTSGYSYGSTGESAHDKAYKDLKVLDTGDTLEALQAKLTKLPLPFEPGTDWIYGISIDILGRVVEKLRQLLHSPALRLKLGRAGRETVEQNYSAKAVAPKFYEVLAKVAQNKRGSLV